MQFTNSRLRKYFIWFSILGIGLLYSILVIGVLNARSFMVNDQGVKFIQVSSLINNQWRSLAIDYPGEVLDPLHEYAPFPDAFFYQKGQETYGIYSVPFVAATSFFYAIFGIYGLYIIPIGATLGTMFLTYHLSARFSYRFSPLAPLIVGLATPMLYYSLEFWEHSASVFLTTSSIFLLFVYIRRPEIKLLILAGLIMGASVWIRQELYAMLPASLLLLILLRPSRFLRSMFAYIVGVTTLIIPLWVFAWSQTGSILGQHVKLAFENSPTVQEHLSPLQMIFPWSSERWVLAIILILVSRAALSRVNHKHQRSLLFVLIGVVILVVGFNIFSNLHLRPDDLLRSFPLVIFLVFLGTGSVPFPKPGDAAHREGWAILTVIVVFCAGVIATSPAVGGPAQWGPRFLLPIYPLLVVLVIYTLEHLSTGNYFSTLPGAAIILTFVSLLVASTAVELRGVRFLWENKRDYERLIVATEEASPVIVTNIWWLSQVDATIFYNKTMFLVDNDQNGTLNNLLLKLRQNGIDSFTFVTTADLPEIHQTFPDSTQWVEEAKREVKIWLNVEFIDYQFADTESAMR